jgi:cytosine/adenosine deaminase-related metal-dependent hydrolase
MNDHHHVLEKIQSRPDAARSVLLKGAAIVSMDPGVGDLAKGDVLIEGDTIAAVGEDLPSPSPETIEVDLAGRIVIPGLIDTHRHCFYGQLRRVAPDCDGVPAYLAAFGDWLGPLYRPEDVYAGNLITTLGCLDAGITTVLDFFHNPRTPEHSDAAISSFQDAGIRGVHTNCGVMGGDFSDTWEPDLHRLQNEYFSSEQQLLSLRVGALGGDFARPEIALAPYGVELAQRLDVGFTCDGVLGPVAVRRVQALADAGLLSPDVLLLHCLDLPAQIWSVLAETGTKVSLPANSDMILGIADGIPSVQAALDAGVLPSISKDIELTMASDLFSEMRTLMAYQRMSVFERRYRGGTDFPAPITSYDVLKFATMGGAEAIGLGDRIGSISVGKQADLVVIDTNAWNMIPLNNVYGSIVSAAETRNVEAVFVAGSPRKWDFDLVGQDIRLVKERTVASRDRLMKAANFDFDVLVQGFGQAKHHF